MGPSLRILPFTIFVAFLALSVKIKDMFTVYPDALSRVRLFSNQAIAVEQNGPNKNMLADGAAQNGADNTTSLTASLANANNGINPVTDPKGNKSNNAAQNGNANNLASLPRDPSHFSQSEIDLLQALAQRRDTLEVREKSLQQREMTIAAVEKRLDEKAAALEGMKAELIQLVNRRNQANDERLQRLVKIYEAMKPREAAQILQKLDTDVAIGVMGLMKEKKLAPILGFMEPGRAQTLSVLMADRQTSTGAGGNGVGAGTNLGNNNAMIFGNSSQNNATGSSGGVGGQNFGTSNFPNFANSPLPPSSVPPSSGAGAKNGNAAN
ncbi:MAG: MotE family protein [Alphaproteobacteria bacterium]|nr:MotE family protein [Alphaproteobacteria bacterium]